MVKIDHYRLLPPTSGKAALVGKFIGHTIDALVERGLVEREVEQRLVRCTDKGGWWPNLSESGLVC